MAKRVAIIVGNGGLDTAYKVLNIATTAAATDAEVAIFFTFQGVNIIHKEGVKMLRLPQGAEHLDEGFKKTGVPSIEELLEIAKESGVRLIGCQMTVDAMGLSDHDLINGVESGGATMFLDLAFDADVTLTF